MKKDRKEDWRFIQANREALLTLGLYGAYFVWWYVCAYGLGGGDPADYTMVWGFPSWFFWSCIAGYPILTVLLWIVTRFFFKEVPLDDADDTDSEAS